MRMKEIFVNVNENVKVGVGRGVQDGLSERREAAESRFL